MKINITEEEKRNILKMHNSLISEQSQVSKVGATNSGGANNQYCTNMEGQMENEFDPKKAGINSNMKVKNLKILTPPDHSNSQFGVIEFDRVDQGKKIEKITLTCGSKTTVGSGKRYDYAQQQYFPWAKMGYSDGIYAQYCSRINTCAGFVA
jgi:hypothetical protein